MQSEYWIGLRKLLADEGDIGKIADYKRCELYI